MNDNHWQRDYDESGPWITHAVLGWIVVIVMAVIWSWV